MLFFLFFFLLFTLCVMASAPQRTTIVTLFTTAVPPTNQKIESGILSVEKVGMTSLRTSKNMQEKMLP